MLPVVGNAPRLLSFPLLPNLLVMLVYVQYIIEQELSMTTPDPLSLYMDMAQELSKGDEKDLDLSNRINGWLENVAERDKSSELER